MSTSRAKLKCQRQNCGLSRRPTRMARIAKRDCFKSQKRSNDPKTTWDYSKTRFVLQLRLVEDAKKRPTSPATMTW